MNAQTKITLGDGDDAFRAKAVGYDVKIMRQVVRLRKMKPDDRREQELILETYMAALGMLVGTPLGDATDEPNWSE